MSISKWVYFLPFWLWWSIQYALDVLIYKIWGSEDREEDDVREKVVVITGANSGVGKSLAKMLAERGAVVVMGCRNMMEAKTAQEDIMYETRSRKVHLLHLDLEDFDSVRRFADEVTAKFPQVNILINNAGISLDSKELQMTRSGYEIHMHVNHLGHFLLTKLLLPNLKAAPPSRVVFLSSSCMVFSELDLDDLMLQSRPSAAGDKWTGVTTLPYHNSKMAMSLTCKELGRQLQGTGVTTYSVCPGLVNSNIFRSLSTMGKTMARISLVFVGLSPDKSSESILYCVLSRKCENETGKFYRFEKIDHSGNRMLKSDTAKRLWVLSEQLVNFGKLEPNKAV